MFSSFCQTGPGDQTASSWAAATAEGQQNFPGLETAGPYNVECEDVFANFGQTTPRLGRLDKGVAEDLSSKWTMDLRTTLKPEPMRRISSKSSAGSNKHRTIKASAKKPRPRVPSTLMSRTSSQYSNYEITGNASIFQDATIGNGQGHMMDPQQYLAQNLDTLSVSSHMASAQFAPGMIGLDPHGLPYPTDMGFAMAQHVNPVATQIYGTGLEGSSPYSLGSLSPESRNSSPGADDTWSAGPLVPSPSTDAHDSPHINGFSPTMARRPDGTQLATSGQYQGAILAGMCDDFSLPPAFNSRRNSNETGESARDHRLYKEACVQSDGLFHCPWEGQASCNHKPEKLKCNYDKFVDSHLKPYRCKVESCENTRFSSTACLLRHEREAHAMHGHGEKPFLCTYEGCERSNPGCGFPRQWNLRDHMRRVHNDKTNPTVPVPASSPPATSGANSSSKGRKRKSKDVSEMSAGKKSSPKSNQGSVAVVEAAPVKVDIPPAYNFEQWYKHQKALQDLVQGWTQPEDTVFLQQCEAAYGHMNSMQKISFDYQNQFGTWQSG